MQLPPTLLLLLATTDAPLRQDDGLELRLTRLESQMEALVERSLDPLLSDTAPDDARVGGLDHFASKVYRADQGVSIGGYGEARYKNFDSASGTDEFDLTRAILYLGYKFDRQWVFNSEIEVEHADEVFAEFAYVDYLHDDSLNVRGGLLLMPMGFVNRTHEPVSYLAADRSLTESWILPSTWREGGGGIHGRLGGFDYELYVVNGMDGTGFGGESGLRGGRQKGSHAKAEDLAVVASLDWTETPGWILGGSIYQGDAGQDDGAGDLSTTIVELHAEVRSGRLWARGLVADAGVDDRDAGDMDLSGWYLEAGFDVLSASSDQALYPFLRYESIDTDTDAGGIDDTVVTYGLHWRPQPQIVLKLDHADYDDSDDDVTTLMLGWVF